MPKTKSTPVKTKKQKLSPAERSNIAKQRWAKRREGGESPAPIISTDSVVYEVNTSEPITLGAEPVSPSPSTPSSTPPPTAPDEPVIPQNPTPEQPPASPESVIPFPTASPVATQGEQPLPPAPHLTPVAPKKQKRVPQPKEFSIALKAAETRLSKALTERAEAASKLAFLQAEIPSLMGIIQALGGSRNALVMPQAPPAFEFSDAVAYQPPVAVPQIPLNPIQAIQGAGAAPPVSRAQGGAIQFGPEVFGALEGSEDDDDIDKFITGPAASSKGWV